MKKIAIVTGGSGGIGRCTAAEFIIGTHGHAVAGRFG